MNYEKESDHLARRLMAAVQRGSLRRVKMALAEGANPNWPSDWPVLGFLGGDREVFPVMFPLARLPRIYKKANQIPVLRVLLDHNADLNLCLAWLAVGPALTIRLQSGLELCFIVHGLPQAGFADLFEQNLSVVKAWLVRAFSNLNAIPEPINRYEKENLIYLHKRFQCIAPLYGIRCDPTPWVLAELI